MDLVRAAGAEAQAFQADVSKSAEVDRAVAAATERFGEIHILVSNAGIAKKKEFVELTDEEWRRTIDVNLGGAMHCARAVAPQMISRGSGRIINLSSLMGGWWGWSDHVHYNASKAGIEGLTRGLAMELGPTVLPSMLSRPVLSGLPNLCRSNTPWGPKVWSWPCRSCRSVASETRRISPMSFSSWPRMPLGT